MLIIRRRRRRRRRRRGQCTAERWGVINDAKRRPAVPCIALYCTALYCTSVYSTLLHWTALHCTALNCTALHCTVLHCRWGLVHRPPVLINSRGPNCKLGPGTCRLKMCTGLCCTAVKKAAVQCTGLYCTEDSRSTVHRTVLHWRQPQYSALPCTAQCTAVISSAVQYGTAL